MTEENSNEMLTIEGNVYTVDSISDETKAAIQQIQITNQGLSMIGIVLDAARAMVELKYKEMIPTLPEPVSKADDAPEGEVN
jgi:hypothetical protein